MSTADTPLIHTALGNLPIADLEHEVRWEDTPDYTKLIDIYRYRGQIVRESAHVLARHGLLTESQTGG